MSLNNRRNKREAEAAAICRCVSPITETSENIFRSFERKAGSVIRYGDDDVGVLCVTVDR